MKIHLCIIDPQGSFCNVVPADQQQILHDGELYVAGADDDMRRLAAFILRLGSKIDDIDVTLDSHYPLHIAHPRWFLNVNDATEVLPFSIIEEEGGEFHAAQYQSDGSLQRYGKYRTVVPSFTRWTVDYLRSLKTAGRYGHMIWPYHCLIGSPGHNVVPVLFEAINSWAEQRGAAFASFLTKGSNYRTEHFSAVQAEVVDPKSPSTNINDGFIKKLMEADQILIAGEALSHCVANTVRDIANYFQDDTFIKKVVLLEDASSNVGGLEFLGEQFVTDMKARGMQTTTTADYLA